MIVVLPLVELLSLLFDSNSFLFHPLSSLSRNGRLEFQCTIILLLLLLLLLMILHLFLFLGFFPSSLAFVRVERIIILWYYCGCLWLLLVSTLTTIQMISRQIVIIIGIISLIVKTIGIFGCFPVRIRSQSIIIIFTLFAWTAGATTPPAFRAFFPRPSSFLLIFISRSAMVSHPFPHGNTHAIKTTNEFQRGSPNGRTNSSHWRY
mmetsp:Transcript_35708/g.86409  ORF Transcript_35708/g.86409 Transcript_35708/m.86409 type:complete len:206 (-) Transcript_35708:627-1244(-)